MSEEKEKATAVESSETTEQQNPLNVTKKKRLLPPRIVLYANPKTGLSTFCTKTKSPLFLNFNNGLRYIDCDRIDLDTLEDARSTIEQLISTETEYKTLIIDNISGLETAIFRYVGIQQKAQDGIESIPYGRGYGIAIDLFKTFLLRLNVLQEVRNMTIICNAHSRLDTLPNQFGESSSIVSPKLFSSTTKGDTASDILCDWADALLFVCKKSFVKGNFFSARNQDSLNEDPNEKIICTTDLGNFKAANRYNLPEEIPFDWSFLVDELSKFYKHKGE